MSNWWKYSLAGAGCLFLGGAGGYYYGYYKSEPEIVILRYETDGLEGFCVYRTNSEMVCAADLDHNGSVDVSVVDVETQTIKEVQLGQDDCTKKYLRSLEKELQKRGHELKQ